MKQRDKIVSEWLRSDAPVHQLLGVDEQDGGRMVRLAASLFLASNFAEAEAAATLATAASPLLYESWHLLGAACARQKKWVEAEMAYTQALTLHPDDIALLGDLGEVEVQMMHYENAAKHLRRAIELDPKSEHPAGRRARAVVGRTITTLRSK